jgi:ubiquinone/menaquinone biosynthesis C-methylase UbiE
MKKSEYQKMYEMEETYWWHVGRKEIIKKVLSRLDLNKNTKILNVGSGTGGTVPMLEHFGGVDNVDTSDSAIAYAKSKGIKNIKKVQGIKLPYKSNSFDVLVALDVLEHIEDDSKALLEWHRVLKNNGKGIITVPAYQWLWSEHDESLHHKRRYTLSELSIKCSKAGFKINKRSYLIVFSFGLIVVYRFLSSLSSKKNGHKSSYVLLPKPINALFISLLKIESLFIKYINFPFGTTAFVVIEK